jgi:hypothetical protein
MAAPVHATCPSIFNALLERAAEEANARLFGRRQSKTPTSRST